MTRAARHTKLYLRASTLVVLSGLLTWCSTETWFFYTDVSPFHQRYELVTPGQRQEVSSRLLAALAGMPLAFMLTLAAIMGAARLAKRPRRAAVLFAALMMLAGLQSCGVYFALPYGFGSEYKHAYPEQLAHLAFSKRTGLIFLAASLFLIALTLAGSKPGASSLGEAPLD